MTNDFGRQWQFEKEWKSFIESGGFKILALAGLSGRALSIVCYLINCELAGTGPILTSRHELGVLLRLNSYDLDEGLSSLREMGIVKMSHNRDSRFLIEFVPDPSKWFGVVERKVLRSPVSHGDLESEPKDSSEKGNLVPLFPQALRFPHVVENPRPAGELQQEKSSAEKALAEEATLKPLGLLDLYLSTHPEQSPERESFFLGTLLEAHPAEQVRRMIEAFGPELKSLGFLAGAWTHFAQKLAELDSQGSPAQLEEMRAQHKKLDEELRRSVRQFLDASALDERVLRPSERVLLHVLEDHDNPRRQLYWALRIRHRYPSLVQFFERVETLAQPPPEPFKRGPRNSSLDEGENPSESSDQ